MHTAIGFGKGMGCRTLAFALAMLVTAGPLQAQDATLPDDHLSNLLNAGLQLGTAEQSAFHERFDRKDLRVLTEDALRLARGALAALPPGSGVDLGPVDALLSRIGTVSDKEAYAQLVAIREATTRALERTVIASPKAKDSLVGARVLEMGVWMGWVAVGGHFYGDRPPAPDMVTFMNTHLEYARKRGEEINQALGRNAIPVATLIGMKSRAGRGDRGSTLRDVLHAAFYRSLAGLMEAGTDLGPWTPGASSRPPAEETARAPRQPSPNAPRRQQGLWVLKAGFPKITRSPRPPDWNVDSKFEEGHSSVHQWDKEGNTITADWTFDFEWDSPQASLDPGKSFSLTFRGKAGGAKQEGGRRWWLKHGWRGFSAAAAGKPIQEAKGVMIGRPGGTPLPEGSESTTFTVPENTDELVLHIWVDDGSGPIGKVEYEYERRSPEPHR